MIANASLQSRIRTFLLILTVLNLPLLLLGLIDLPQSPTALLRALIVYCYYGIYYLLTRAGYGVAGTYGCLALLTLLIASGVHDTGGFLIAVVSLYFLMLVGAGTVLQSVRGLDMTLLLCLATYSGLIWYELGVAPPLIYQQLYTNIKPLPTVSITVVVLVSLIGTWLVIRNNLIGLQRATSEIETAHAEAETRASENAALAAEVQTTNQSLVATEARLRETIDALALPLIPLEEGIALLPLIGYLDERRADGLVEGLLKDIHDQQVRSIVLDITGLREINAQVATTLVHAARAAHLLGADVVLSGISPIAAQTLVDLNTDLRHLRTAGSLADALRLAAADQKEN